MSLFIFQKKFLVIFILAWVVGWGSPLRVYGAGALFDHSTWDNFLKEFVNENGDVNYGAVRANPAVLDDYLAQLGRVNPETRQKWPREERLAFWLNAYHAALIRTVLDYYPVKSVNDIPGFWDMDKIKVGTRSYSLNGLRYEELIGTFRDEKINVAVSCGARGCPRLRREAFTGPRVEGQLFMATREFVNNPERNGIVPGKKQIRISRIFKWYARDFRMNFGTASSALGYSDDEEAVLAFLHYYLDDPVKKDYLEERRYKIKYQPFDWSLNDWTGAVAGPAPSPSLT